MSSALVDGPGALLLIADLALLAILIAAPLRRSYRDDRGDGKAHVVLPVPPPAPSPWRTTWFFVFFFVLSLLYIGAGVDSIDRLYGGLVGGLARLAVHNSATVAGYVVHAHLGTRFVLVAYILGLAVSLRAAPLRRAMVAAQALWYLAAMICLDATQIMLGALTGWPIQPFGLQGNLLANVVGIIVFMRLTFLTFMLPKPVDLPRRNQGWLGNTVIISMVLVAAVALLWALPFGRALWDAQGLLPIVLSYALPSLVLTVIYCVLLVLQAVGPPPPPLTEERPAIDVIVPAHNEGQLIAACLTSIDGAAVTYGGPVRVIVGNDGSTDRTAAIARRTIKRFRAATGTVVDVEHGGKVRALNAALAQTRAEIVVRIDADVSIDHEALTYAQRWFTDPSVGEVSALVQPSEGRSWIHQMRLFECLMGFGLSRRALQVVDAIQCVPGTFAAFRREPVLGFGGFTDGINGEDSDLTMVLGRLGYRTVLDVKVRIYEDVPSTVRTLSRQRIRWNRAGMHMFARHVPFRAGATGPRAWFAMLRLFVARITGVLRLLIMIHAIQLAVLVPAYRTNLGTLLIVVLLTMVPGIYVLALLAAVYGRAAKVVYLPLWSVFANLRRFFIVQALLTLPTRPAGLAALRRPASVPEPAELVGRRQPRLAPEPVASPGSVAT
ncbi:MAG: glycosyltransferase [Candidatus Dormibacteria bacterium]